MADEQTEKAKVTRGIMATLPTHAQEEMREANRELGMALEVVRGIVDAAVAEALPPGKVTELVVRKRREDDEAALARRRQRWLPLPPPAPDEALATPPDKGPPTAQVVDLMGALKESLKKREGAS